LDLKFKNNNWFILLNYNNLNLINFF
jgi:hypothetical protein